MAHDQDQKKPPRGRRTLGLIVASTVATAPVLGCDDSPDPARDTGAAMAVMDAAPVQAPAPMDAAAPVDAAAPMDTAAAMDAAAPRDAVAGMETALAMEAGGDSKAGSDGAVDAGDAGVDYPPGVRG